ncbi:MAG: PIG-L family deacetylase [Nocardioides sp.]
MTTLLGIWAHPDDEAYCSSGLMAQVRDDGSRVVVVTATRGEHGTGDPDAWPPERLAALRERELRESLAQAGVTEHRWLGHRDGELDRVAVEAGAATLLSIIEEVRPTVIVTFGPEGMTGHADHRAISAWTTHAWHASGERAALWYATLTPEFHRAWGDLNDEVGLWMDGSAPPTHDASQLAAEVRLSGRRLDRKHRALRAHASQTRGLEELVGADRYRRWWSTESFVAAVRRRPATSTGDGPSAVRAG